VKQVLLVLHRAGGEIVAVHRSAWAAVALTVVLWASAFAAIRAALEGFSAVELSVLRLVIASLALAVVAPFMGLRRPAARDLPALIVAGALGMTAYQLLLNAGEESVTAGTASLLVSMSPILAALLAAAFLGERISRRARAGTALAFAGAVVIALGQGGGIALSHGALLVLGAALCQAAFFVVQKPLLARYSAFEVTAYAMWSGTVLLLPLGAGVPGAVAAAGLEPLIAVALLAVGASAVGFLAWAFALARLPVSTASSALYAVPVVAIFVAFVWLGELPSAASVVGGGIALAGVVLATRSAHAEGDRARPARRGQRQRVAAGGQGAPVRAVGERERPRAGVGGL
jgi:drug/metabolite transporter (DMT)-like permease